MKKIYALMIVLFLVTGVMGQWYPQNSGTTNNLNSVYFTDANTGYAVGDTGTILKTTDGGLNWTPQISNTNQNLRSVFFTGVETGYAVGDDSLILKTTNGGNLWASYSSGITGWFTSIFFIDEDNGYAIGVNGIGADSRCVIIKTTDGGSHWSIKYTSDSHYQVLESIFFPDPNTGYVVGANHWLEQYGRIYKTTNAGTDWTLIYNDPNISQDYYYSVYFINADTGIAVGDAWSYGWWGGGKILRTTNGGVDWTSQNLPSDKLLSVFFTDESTAYVVGKNYEGGDTIYKTTDGGYEWIYQPLKILNKANSLYFPSPDTGYVVGDSGNIRRTTNGGGFPVGIDKQHHTTNTLNIYPNPAYTTITISIPTKGSLYIHSISGQQLLEQTITEPTTTIDVSGLKIGVYFVRVTGEKNVSVGKFIKQ